MPKTYIVSGLGKVERDLEKLRILKMCEKTKGTVGTGGGEATQDASLSGVLLRGVGGTVTGGGVG